MNEAQIIIQLGPGGIFALVILGIGGLIVLGVTANNFLDKK